MTSLTLVKSTPVFKEDLLSYQIKLEVTASNNIPKEVFVKQRLATTGLLSFEDNFAAVATPSQLEDLLVGAPDETTSYFRVDNILLTLRTAEYLSTVVASIEYELQKLVEDVQHLSDLSNTTTVVFSSP